MAEFVMPQLGADMSAGKLLGWRKNVGESVSRGDIIADVETDKADIEVEVFTSGVIEKILVQPGERVPVGTVLAIIHREGEAPKVETPAAPRVAPSEAAPARPAAPVMPVLPSVTAAEPGRVHVSPVARKAAAELGIDLASLAGTGPGGRITLEDVQKAAQAKAAQPVPSPELDRRTRMRQAIAAAMARSKREIPHYYLSTTIDMNRVMAWLTQENLKRSVEDRLLYGVLLLKAVALALHDVAELNSVWSAGKAVQLTDIHVGVAISLRGGGLVAPALHNADRRSLDELMKDFRDLVQRARSGSLRSSELSDPTITVTSLGEQGVEAVFGIIYPPQVALVGFGKITDRPWSSEGQIVSRPVVTATLSGDHRVSDGHRGGIFLAAVDRLLQEPEKL
ncbi:MAG: dihydrolipoamide acetyltransferase family protein [Candidatus Acidiferrales bacterium]|jgi:pyruvate dehydrogenase E2 component (dihydrolipoamide acetyltransferase)